MPKGKLLKIAQENERGELELRMMNEDKHDEIKRLLGMQRPKKPAPPVRRKPRYTQTRAVSRRPGRRSVMLLANGLGPDV